MKMKVNKINDIYHSQYSQLIFNKNWNELNWNEKQNVLDYEYDLDHQKWKRIIIDNKETNYSVSNIGNIRNDITNKIYNHPNEKTNKYQYTSITINNIKHKVLIHRIVAMAFIPNPENKPEVNHINGNKTFNWVGNLEWNTRLENADHASREGLMLNGSLNPTSKFTENDAHNVCKLAEKGLGAEEISKKLNISKSFVVGILFRGEWKSVSKYYKIPEHKSFSDENEIHKICKELEKGKRTFEIVNDLNVDRRLVETIKYGKAWRRISNKYNIPGLDKVENLPERNSTKIRDLINNGVNDTNEIIKLLGLPDTKGQKKYISRIRKNMNLAKSSSTSSKERTLVS